MIRILLSAILCIAFCCSQLNAQDAGDKSSGLPLTQKEKQFISANPVIHVGQETDYVPFSFAAGNQAMGYSVDLLNLLATRAGLKPVYVVKDSMNQLLALFEKGQITLIHSINRTPSREEIGLFSSPYRSYQNRFVTLKEAPDIQDISQLYRRVVAVKNSWHSEEFLKKNHPEIQLLVVKKMEDIISAVLEKRADAMFGEAPVLSYLLKESRGSKLKMSGLTEVFNGSGGGKYHFFVPRGKPELISILNKSMAALSSVELDNLEYKWFGMSSPSQKKITLSAEEQQFIRDTPSIVLGGGVSFEPFIMADSDGSITGHDVEIARLVGKITGLDVRFIVGEWSDIQKQVERRQVDGLTSTGHYPERERYCSYTLPYIKVTGFIFVKKGNPHDIHSPEDLFERRGAFQKGNLAFKKIVSSHVDEQKNRYYDTIHDVVRAVVSDEADFFALDEAAFYVAAGLGLGGFIEPVFPLGDSFDLSFCLRNDAPELVSIFNKGLKSIPQAEKARIRKKWFGYEHGSSDSGENETVRLTPYERAYLTEKKIIRVCPGGKGTQPQLGMAKDLFPLINDRLVLDGSTYLFERKSGGIDALVNGECDFVVLADSNYSGRDGLDLTHPVMSFPYVVATTMDKIYIEDPGNETDNIFAVLNSSVFIDRLKRTYPSMKLLVVPGIRDGLEAVRAGRVFGYIDSYVAMAYAIQNQLMPGVKIAGQLKFNEDFCLATRSEDKVLGQILQKVIGSISEAEKKTILEKWISVKYEKGINYTLVWSVAAVSVVVFSGIAYWNRRLNKEKQRAENALTAQKEAIRQNVNFIDMISHEYRTPMSVIVSSLELIDMKLPGTVYSSIKPQMDDLKKSSEKLVDIFNTALHEKRISENGISSHFELVDLNNIIRTAIESAMYMMPEIMITFHSDSKQLILRADPDMIGIAIGNILSNACKYSKNNTPVDVFVDQTRNAAVIRVKDNGIGIHKRELHRVFEKYYRADTVMEISGAGVGLYLVKKVVDQHGGNISISSTLGKGTQVVVRLPLIDA